MESVLPLMFLDFKFCCWALELIQKLESRKVRRGRGILITLFTPTLKLPGSLILVVFFRNMAFTSLEEDDKEEADKFN